jgi:Listeria-Bacteroides repeat domain (List_Bact_rpt).
MKTKIYLLLIALVATIGSAWGQSVGDNFSTGGINYRITSIAPNTVDVARGSYSGNVVVPATVAYEGQNYSVTGLVDLAFEYAISDINSTALNSVTLPEGILRIGNYAFGGNRAMTSVNIPSTVTHLGSGVFNYCESLSSVVLPEGVVMSGTGVALFRHSGVTSVHLPASLTIELTTFEGCSKLESITVAAGSTQYSAAGGVLFDKDQKKIILYPAAKSGLTYTMPSTVEDAYFTFGVAFASKSLTAVSGGNPSFFSSVDGVLYNASGTSLLFCPMGKSGILNIPATVTSLAPSAFRGGNLTMINIPSSVVSIGNSGEVGEVFADNESLTIINVSGGSSFSSVDGVLFDFGQAKLLAYPTAKSDIVDYDLTGMTTLTSIEGYAFTGNLNVETVICPSSLTSIGHIVFQDAKKLKTVTSIDNVTAIGRRAFYRSSLESITLPNNSGYTLIRLGTFASCDNLTSIEIPANVLTIEDNAFNNCSNLGNVVLHEGLATIGSQAFASTAISEITIPSSVTNISQRAFASCRNLETIVIHGTLPTMPNNGEFHDIGKNPSILLPDVLEADANNWFNSNSFSDDTRENMSIGKYAVTFVYNNGEAPVVVATYDALNSPADPTRSGNDFQGWYDAATDGNLWDFDSDVVTGDMTLYAYWLATPPAPVVPPVVTYTVTITPLSGVTVNKTGGSVDAGRDFSFTAEARSGYSVIVSVNGTTLPAISGFTYFIEDIRENKTVTFRLVAGSITPTPPTPPGDGTTPPPPVVDPVIPGPGDPAGPGQIIIDENTPSELPGEFPGDGQIIIRPPLVDPNDPTPPKVIIDGKEVDGTWTTDEDGNPVFVIDLDGLEDGKHTIIINDKEFEFTVDKNARPTSNDVLSTATVTAGYGSITIETPNAATVQVVSFSGSVVYNAKVTGTTTVNVPAGIYAVVVDGTVTKVVVR